MPYDVGPEKAVDSVSVLGIVGLLMIVVFAGYERVNSSEGSCRDFTNAVDAELVGTVVTG